jgi:hypothetical protein
MMTKLTPAQMRRTGWVRSTGVGYLSIWWTHQPSGWVIRHCGHPTANLPWALYAPDGFMHCTGGNPPVLDPSLGTAWRHVGQAADYVARVVAGELELKPGRDG